MLPLSRSVLNFGWQEEPGLAAVPACARARAEQKRNNSFARCILAGTLSIFKL